MCLIWFSDAVKSREFSQTPREYIAASHNFSAAPRAQASSGAVAPRRTLSHPNGLPHGSGPGKRLARAFHLINVVVVAVAFAWLCSAASYVFSHCPTATNRCGAACLLPCASWSCIRRGCQKLASTSVMLGIHPNGCISFYCTRALEYKPQKGEERRALGFCMRHQVLPVCKIYTDMS